MGSLVRECDFDVVVIAGPGFAVWPSVGVRSISALCSEMGLTVGVFGGVDVTVRGVIPLPVTGALVIAEDAQRRVHRVNARAVVRLSRTCESPDPFPGWRSAGLLPLSTARKILEKVGSQRLFWGKSAVLLGSGNKALQFGVSLLELGVPEVHCVETNPQWGAKRFSGWEVWRRRFEMCGGKLLEAKPIKLAKKAVSEWEISLKETQAIRQIDVAWVISAGPFGPTDGIKEYPPSSFLFELEQTSLIRKEDDVEGWVLEEERGTFLGGKIAKSLVSDPSVKREAIEKRYRLAKSRIRRHLIHREKPFTPSYQGKWTSAADLRVIRDSRKVPQALHKRKEIACIECFEDVSCDLCKKACIYDAINEDREIAEELCTGCGVCVKSCPSGSVVMLHEREDRPTSLVTLLWRGASSWKIGDFAALVNRRGDSLGSGRISDILFAKEASREANQEANMTRTQVIKTEVPTHLIWEARSVRSSRTRGATDENYVLADERSAQNRLSVTLGSDRRLMSEGLSVSEALFEIGLNRPEDALICSDGSCGLCHLTVDGAKRSACQTPVRGGMALRLPEARPASTDSRAEEDGSLCGCLGITREQVVERIRHGYLRSPEAILSVVHVGEGRCHGQICMEPFKRILSDQGLDVSQWIDWRFPSSDWVLPRI